MMICRLILLLAFFALPGLAGAQGTVVSVFEVQNNTGATLVVNAVRDEHGEAMPELELRPGERRVMRLPVGNWTLTVRAPRVRGVDPVERRFFLPDAGPYGIALAAGDFGQTRMEDGPWTDAPAEDDTAERAGLPAAVRRGIAAEYPPRVRSCEALTLSAVDPYFAFIPSNETCAAPWAQGGFHEGRRVCRICPQGSEWEAARNCCRVR